MKLKKEVLITNTAVGLKKLNPKILKTQIKEIRSVFKSKYQKETK
jgi:hypothetical protein